MNFYLDKYELRANITEIKRSVMTMISGMMILSLSVTEITMMMMIMMISLMLQMIVFVLYRIILQSFNEDYQG